MPKILKSQFFLIYFAAFITIVAFSMVFPLLPAYAKMFSASDTTIGFLASSYALSQFLFSPVWGKLTDRFGRRPIILAGLSGVSITFLAFGFATSITWLFIARFVQGIFSAATMTTARAYIADITTKEERIKSMGRLGASTASGVVLGPALGGLLSERSISDPFFLGAAITFVNLLFVFFFLPESLEQKFRTTILPRADLFYDTFKSVWQGLRSSLAPLFFLTFIWSFTMANNQVSLPLLGLQNYGLSNWQIGLLFAVMGIVLAIGQFFLVERISSAFGSALSIVSGLLLLSCGFALTPFVPQAYWMYGTLAMVGMGSAISRPVIVALVSRHTKEQGAAMGTVTAFASIGRFLGPLLGGVMFSLFPAAPFLFTGILVVLVLAFVVKQTPFMRLANEPV